jgi:hypothetical protein
MGKGRRPAEGGGRRKEGEDPDADPAPGDCQPRAGTPGRKRGRAGSRGHLCAQWAFEALR